MILDINELENDKITEILSEEFIGSLKSSVTNIEQLTRSANTTLEKATLLNPKPTPNATEHNKNVNRFF